MEIQPVNPIDSEQKDYNKPKGISKLFQPYKQRKIDLPWGVIFGATVAAGLIALFVIVVVKHKNESLLSPFSHGVSDENIDTGPKIMNPLTGVMHSESQAEKWLELRPLGVMINNHTDARPQAGLSEADVIYEIVAEGGITRYIAFFLTNAPEKLGPIRSAREYYLVLVKELGDAMIMHHGYSPQALRAIESWPVRSLERGAAPYFRENPRNVASEHTLYASGVELRKRADELGWEGVGDLEVWQFKDSVIIEDREQEYVGENTLIEIDFWSEGSYSAIFKYDRGSNMYDRYTGYSVDGEPLPVIDENNDEQVKVRNVIVQFVEEAPIAGDDKSRLTYELVGSGEGIVFMDGASLNVTWSKANRDARTMFYDLNGDEVEFSRGVFWICIVPDRNKDQVSY